MTSVSHDSFSTADPYVGRSAPWSPEAEQAVLGAMLLDQDAALRAVELVDDTMFYREEHRRLFRAMRALVERRSVIDPVTLNDELERRGELGQTVAHRGAAVQDRPAAARTRDQARPPQHGQMTPHPAERHRQLGDQLAGAGRAVERRQHRRPAPPEQRDQAVGGG